MICASTYDETATAVAVLFFAYCPIISGPGVRALRERLERTFELLVVAIDIP